VIPRLELPPPRTVLVLVALAFALPGLAAHDPWKSFDAIAIEIVHQMQRTGNWIVPHIGGDPWIEDPPLYHWVALVFAKAFSWVLPLHAAARLASGLFVLGAFWFIYAAARAWAPEAERRGASSTALLVLLGSIGLIVHAHEAVADLAALTATCAAFLCWSHAERRPLPGGFGFGASLGAAFLAAGPVVPAAIYAAAVVAHLVSTPLRTRGAMLFLGSSLLLALALSGGWMLAYALRAPDLAAPWWGAATQPRGEFLPNLRYYLVTSSWFTWPAWPLALWALWMRRKALLEPRTIAPLASFLVIFIAIAYVGPQQDINCIAFLPALALLAPQGIDALRRGAANALDWFGVMTFGLFGALVWLGYVAMLTGQPSRIAKNFIKAAPGFTLEFSPLAVGFAALLLAAWLAVVVCAQPSPARGPLRWATGIALLWGSFATLWLPWADYQKSYRGVALELKSKIPAGTKCVGRASLGNAQRAALSYHGDIHTQPFDPAKPAACPLVIVQGNPQYEQDAPGPKWVKVAETARPRDKNERFRLYRYKP
jgi:4-amino-4-deoxy-L-arabinose transferase-like glycosyltransferase